MLSPFWRSLLIYREFGDRIGIYRLAEAKLTIHFKGLTNFASPIMYLNENGFHTSSQSFQSEFYQKKLYNARLFEHLPMRENWYYHLFKILFDTYFYVISF